MRLSKFQIQNIKNSAINIFGLDTKIFLFGSRVDDTKKGGDIDLYIKPQLSLDEATLYEFKIRFLTQLKRLIGQRKIDVIIHHKNHDLSFIEDIQQSSILL